MFNTYFYMAYFITERKTDKMNGEVWDKKRQAKADLLLRTARSLFLVLKSR